jgi:PAS domain S-box-containing protein
MSLKIRLSEKEKIKKKGHIKKHQAEPAEPKKRKPDFLSLSLERVDKLYKTLFEAFTDGIYILDKKSLKILDANSAACALYGYSNVEMRKLKVTDISAEKKKTRDSIKKSVLHIGYRLHKKKDGTVFPVEINASTLKMDGRFYHIVQIRDIARRLKTEQKIHQIASLPKFNPNPVIEIDCSKKIIFSNPEAEKTIRQTGVKSLMYFLPKDIDNLIKTLGTKNKGPVIREINIKNRYFEENIIYTPEFKTYRIYCREITNQKYVESRLLESEGLLKEAQHLAKTGSWNWDLVTGEITWSDELYSITGRDKKLKPPSYAELPKLYSKETIKRRDEAIKRIMKTGETVSIEVEFTRFDNRKQGWLNTIIKAEKNKPGKTVRLFGTSQEITERKEAEKKLKEKEESLTEAQQLAKIGNWSVDLISGGIIWSDEMFKITGRDKNLKPPSLKETANFYTPESIISRDEAVKKSIKTGINSSYDAELIRFNDKKHRWIHTIIKVEKNEKGKVVKLFGTAQDITERKEAEKALKEWNETLEKRVAERTAELLKKEEELYNAMQLLNRHLDNSPLAIVEFDNQFHITRWSSEAEKIFGWKSNEILGKSISEMKWVYEDDIKLVEKESVGLFDGTRPRSVNFNRNYRKDGSIIYCEWYNSAVYDSGRKLKSVLSQILDVTARKLAEKALKESEERFRKLYSSMSEGVVLHELICDGSGNANDYRILEANSSFEKITGIKKEYAKGKLASELYGTGSAPFLDIYSRVVLTGISIDFETEFEPMRKSFRISVFSPEKGKFATVFSDITERKNWEEKINKILEELQVKNDELTRFNNVMIGRELRMIELKKEINELCGKTGEPQRYLQENNS